MVQFVTEIIKRATVTSYVKNIYKEYPGGYPPDKGFITEPGQSITRGVGNSLLKVDTDVPPLKFGQSQGK